MGLLFQLLTLVFNVLIVLLFVRYFLDEQSHFQFGPLIQMIYQVTDPIVKPVRTFIVATAPRYYLWSSLLTMLCVVVLRGVLYSGLSTMFGDKSEALHGFLLSFEQAADLIFWVSVSCLFASTLFSRSGFVLLTNTAYRAFQEGTFKVFRISRALWKTDRMWPLFWGSVILLLVAHFLFVSLVSLRVFDSAGNLLLSEFIFVLDSILIIVRLYWFVLLVAIIASWLTAAGPGANLPAVRAVRALSEPYLGRFRQWFRWARWGIIDFSPIIAFIALSVLEIFVQDIRRDLILGPEINLG